MDQKDLTGLEIAIVGYSGRFAGCESMEDFWQQLADGRSSIHDFSTAELEALGLSANTYESPGYVKSNGILDQKDCFDAEFWGYTPAEAAVMDPQMRIFHECVWEALEMAGYAPDATKGKVGVFGYGSNNAHWQTLLKLQGSGTLDPVTVQYFSNVELICSRVAYRLNLKGPAVFVSTACSSSLVAVHQACRALLTGECDMALAGGVCASLLKQGGYMYTEGYIFSGDGKCRPFDHLANGTVSGEGGGVVTLKRYSQALKDGDQIHGIIRGSATNNDGSDKIAYTAPSVKGQVDVIKKALSVARISEDSLSFIESHGTGTKLGDAIELKALDQCFGSDECNIHVGAVKSNIGHLDGASGIAGLLKVLLMFRHKKIPATAHFESMNSEMKEVENNLCVNGRLIDWPRNGTARRAGISSFGIGGTNVHIVLQEPAIPKKQVEKTATPRVFVLSAKTPSKLEQVKARLAAYLELDGDFNSLDISFTLLNRTPFASRTAIVAENRESLINQLRGQGGISNRVGKKGKEPVAFVFGGQGTQYHRMLEQLYDAVPSYRALVDKCFLICKNEFGIDLKSILFSNDNPDLHETLYTQLALFTVQYAYARLLIDLGVKPYALIGHSIGEYVAVTLAEVYTLENALKIVHKRGLLMQENCKGGAMCAVFTDRKELNELLPENLEVGAENGPEFQVVSGSRAEVEKWAALMQEKGFTAKMLEVQYAFHSRAMDVILPEFQQFLTTIPSAPAKIPVISNLTGDFNDRADAAYWSGHMRNTVLFTKGVETLLASGYNTFVDFGFGKQLNNTINSLKTNDQLPGVLEAIRHKKKSVSDQSVFLSLVGGLWANGYVINQKLLFDNASPGRIALPTYPFERVPFAAPFNVKSVLAGKLDFGIAPEESHEQWIYKPEWIRSTSLSGRVHKPARVLVICNNREELTAQIQPVIEEADKVVYLHHANKQSGLENDGLTFRLNLQESDLNKAMESLAREGFVPDTIIHALGMEQPESTPVNIDKELKRGYLNLTFVIRAVHNHFDVSQLHLAVLSQNLFTTGCDEAVNPLNSCMAGALKVMSVEYGYLYCKIIDTGKTHTTDSHQSIIKKELHSWQKYSAVAIRNDQRFIHEIKPYESQSVDNSPEIRQEDCVLVIGGLGGMGLAVGADLAERENHRVVLIHRSAFPSKTDWRQLVQDETIDETTRTRLRRLLQLDRSGARVHLYQADVTKPDQMKQVLADIRAEVGDIRAVIWAAGVIDEAGVVQKRSPESLITTIESKVHGLIQLEQLLDFNKLSYLTLFSSMGNINYENKGGQIGYNVANEFLEAFAWYAHDEYSCKIVAINWIDWTDVGMSVRALKSRFTDLSIEEINDKIEGALTPSEGVAVFRHCLTHPTPVYYLSKSGLGTDKQEDEPVLVTFTRPEISTPFVFPEGKKEQEIAEILTTTFGIDRVGRDDDFFELGGDSLKAIQVTNYLKKSFDRRVSLEQFYAHPTIAELAKLLTADGDTAIDKVTEVAKVQPAEFPALAPQRQIHVATELFPEATNYNQPFIYKVDGLDTGRLKEVLQTLIARHQALRTSFNSEGAALLLRVAEKVDVHVGSFEVQTEDDLASVLDRFVVPFNLKEAPLFRVAVAASKENSTYLLVDLHHIISDGISNLTFLNELLTLYEGGELPTVENDLLDYINHLQTDALKTDQADLRDYWLERFRELPDKINLPGTRGVEKTFEGEIIDFELADTLHKDISSICKREGITSFVFYLTAFNVLLHKLSSTKDIVVGTTLTGRDEAGFENTMGMFVQTLALRNGVEPDEIFPKVLKQTKEQTTRDFDHRSYPLEDLLRELNVSRSDQSNPLFDIVFAGENLLLNKTVLSENEATKHLNYMGFKEVVFDLLFSFFESEKKTVFSLEFKKSRFDATFIRQLFQYYQRILEQVIKSGQLNPVKIADLQLLDKTEITEVLKSAHGESCKYRSDQTIGAAFSAIASGHAEEAALLTGEQTISYAEVETRSNELAHCLLTNYDLMTGDTVGVMLDRSPAMLISMLGIIKAGGVFVPIAPEYPWVRKEHILVDSGAKVLLTDSVHMFSMGGSFEGHIVAMDIQEAEIQEFSSEQVEVALSPSDLAYIIYTSGSTGKPKGVMVEHRSLMNYIDWASKTYIRNRKTIVPLHTNISFDLTLTSVFLPLLTGNRIMLVGESQDLLLKWILEKGDCNLIKLTPSHLRALRAQGLENLMVRDGLRLVVGGEALDTQLADTIHKHYLGNIEIFNEYGPTEATIGCMVHQFNPTERLPTVPIGRPIDNATIYLLDDQLQPVVPGMTGEIYIAGSCLARGYMNQPVLTAERFVEDVHNPGRRMYQTGDLAMALTDGNLVYLGRKDEQVKIRGYRIELAEISNTLSTHRQVQEAVVIQSGDEENPYLVAYYVGATGLGTSDLRDHLAQELPDYMLPSYYKRIDTIPLTTNGKINKKALPEYISVSKNISKPEGKVEEQLLRIWAEALNRDPQSLSVTSRFFHMGGDSLRALTIIRQVEQQMGTRVSVKDFFDKATIRAVASLIADAEEQDPLSISVPKVEKREVYPASSAQERMLFEQLMDEESLKYNTSMIYRLNEEVDAGLIQQAFQQLIERHDCFRTRIFIDDSEIVQQIVESVSFELESLNEQGFENVSDACQSFVRPFDMMTVPMLRCALLDLPGEGRYLLVDTHHVVCDGISLNILMNEFMSLITTAPLAATGLRYVDYAHWQKSKVGDLSKQGEFWTKQLSGKIPRINLPVQRERSSRTSVGAKKSFETTLEQIHEISVKSDTSSYMLLLALYYIVMHKFSGDNDIIVGTDGDGRSHAGFSQTVGTFINVLPLRLVVDSDMSLSELLPEVKSMLLQALDNQDFPFDRMKNLIGEGNEGPIVDIYFSYTNFFDEGLKFLSAGFTPVHLTNRAFHASYELELNVIEEGNKLSFDFIYDQSLFDEGVIDQIAAYYHYLLIHIAESFDTPVGQLEFELVSSVN